MTKTIGKQTLSLILVFIAVRCFADGPKDNNPETVRPVPPIGIAVSVEQSSQLLKRCNAIREGLANVSPEWANWSSEVEVFPRAVEMTLKTQMVYSKNDLKNTSNLLAEAERRLNLLLAGKTEKILTGTSNPRLIVGGFRSKIDNSIQPYGFELPESYASNAPLRLDVWLHGRGEKVSEVGFLAQRSTKPSQYAPANTIVLHPYGRYSNAFKFAGEIDVIESIEHIKNRFKIDDQRITIRGFSMGGAGCWQLAVHYPQLWAAATPGAGFSETTEFLRVFQNEVFQPTDYQARLLHWYDCPDWTNNLRNVPTVAYSGEIDKQKQAADVMEAAFEREGMKLPHIIGPETGHKIHPDSKVKIQSLIDQHLSAGKPQVPKSIDLTTYTLRYNQMGWITVESLQEHWVESRVQGTLSSTSVKLKTSNITGISVNLPSGSFTPSTEVSIAIDGQSILATTNSHGQLALSLHKKSENWQVASDKKQTSKLRKKHGLQGPIDDAFMNSFCFVAPDMKGSNQIVDEWVADEYKHAKQEWIRQFRGDIIETSAVELTESDIANNNLIVFGTPKTNSFLASVIDQLPIKWDGKSLRLGKESFDANHVPILIFPNPKNPDRYLVLNSGFTYREYAYLNNARQIPMLPDWAVADVSEGSNSQMPGKVVRAGFFTESWQLSEQD